MRVLSKIAFSVVVAATCIGGAAPALADGVATAPAAPVESLPGDDFGNDNGILALAPSCVHLQQGRNGSTAWANSQNTCSSTQRYRMIWAWAADGACVTVSSGGSHNETRGAANIPPRPSVTELRLC
jgi:hypothetical protein